MLDVCPWFQRLCTLLVLLACGCGGSLQLSLVNSEQRKPNNVWVFFTAQKRDEPVAGLGAEHFKIYEDGALVSPFESKQVIQNPEVAAVMYTLLLLDVSGSITESGQIEPLVDAAEMFIERVGKTQKVAVYAFDGADKIHPIVAFTETEQTLKGGLEGLRRYKPRDPSTNLHGAVVQGLERLKLDLDHDRRPLKFGTLVVFSDGADRAARVSRESMRGTIAEEAYRRFELFAIGIGEASELAEARLSDIGRDGTEQGTDHAKIKEAFDRIAAKIEAHSKRFYLLSYCTPARNGEHVVRIELRDEKLGKGALEYSFQAAGFGPPPDCNPDRPPTFSLKQVDVKAASAR